MKLTKEDKIKIIELREKGQSFTSIANLFNIYGTTVERIWYRYEIHGINSIMHPAKNRSYSAEFKLEILKRVLEGESKIQLAAEYNLPGPGTIVAWMKKYEELGYNGLERKQGRPRGRPNIMAKEEKKNTLLTNDEREELIRLRKEKEYLEMENEILKKLDALVMERLKQQKKKK